MVRAMQMNEEEAVWYKKVSCHSAIHRRYSVLPDFLTTRENWTFWGEDFPKRQPTFTERNNAFKKHAPPLARDACEKALINWGGGKERITHIIAISCTGIMAPGIEVKLMESLGLESDVDRLGINFMGCFGAFKGLGTARALAAENPKNRILVVCVELCSLHFQKSPYKDTLLANALFSDGAAAAVVGAAPSKDEPALWKIEAKSSRVLEHSHDDMTWEPGEHALVMHMTRGVPERIRSGIKVFAESLLGPGIPFDRCDWALHPGGKAILHGIEMACGLKKEQTAASWEVLSRYGNMSSPTFLFVLDQLDRLGCREKWTAGFGFGPGLSVEGILLKRL